MKYLYKLMFLVMASAMAGALSNCSDDSDGNPVVRYVRVTDPTASDSLLVAAGQGQMIAIMGENLKDVREVWFNDQRAVLTTTFISNTSIITSVPSQLPEVVTNQMTLVFGGGKTIQYDFSVDVSEPVVSRMKSEYVNAGEIATFYGDYFYEPLVVTFTGGAMGEVVSVEDQILTVRVPDGGVQPGPVVISNIFGDAETDFWFRDNRNIIASFDIPMVNGVWHGPNYVVSSDPDISSINNKFIRMKNDLGAWAWFELYVGTAGGDLSTELKNIPEDAFENPDDYNLKFELNTLASLTGANLHLYLGQDMPGERGTNYNWLPNINTEGEWETITIPWKDVYVANKNFAFNSNGYGISFHFSGPNAVDADFGLDNMRVVPKVTEE